jgi:hypothetical protein
MKSPPDGVFGPVTRVSHHGDPALLDGVDAPSDQTLPRRIAHLDMDAFFASVELPR